MPVKLHLFTQYHFHYSGTGIIGNSVHKKVSRGHIVRRDSMIPDSFSYFRKMCTMHTTVLQYVAIYATKMCPITN